MLSRNTLEKNLFETLMAVAGKPGFEAGTFRSRVTTKRIRKPLIALILQKMTNETALYLTPRFAKIPWTKSLELCNSEPETCSVALAGVFMKQE
jgi:hypothetical protein